MSEVETGFNLNEDVKELLVPSGKGYHGSIVEASISDDKPHLLNFQVVITDPDKKMSDGETPVEGQTLFYFVIIPQEEHRGQQISTGENKWQFFVNMLARFAKGMKINLNTLADINQALEDGSLLGIPVVLEIKQEEYQGNISSKIKSMKRDESPSAESF